MLPRVLEPEVMDSPEEASDYDSMDHSTVNRIFADDFLAFVSEATSVLDVGTGTAQIPIEICRRLPAFRVVAIDAAAAMLELARANVARAGLADRIEVRLVDAKGLPFPDASWPALVSNSIVHHIPEPRGVLAEIARVTTPGGAIFVRDLLRPDDDAQVARLVDLYAANATRRQRQLFDDSLRAALSLAEIREIVASLGFDTASVQQTSDRHWTWMTRR